VVPHWRPGPQPEWKVSPHGSPSPPKATHVLFLQ
jgi:hypothetical protein